uniref:Uncharacterized protein n=1 Tax=Anguilla anguilla TaxID=7936 RepID=A0A0E9QUX0_ANGAN
MTAVYEQSQWGQILSHLKYILFTFDNSKICTF